MIRQGLTPFPMKIHDDLLMTFFSSQLNCVVMRGLNDDEICDFVALTEKKVNENS